MLAFGRRPTMEWPEEISYGEKAYQNQGYANTNVSEKWRSDDP